MSIRIGKAGRMALVICAVTAIIALAADPVKLTLTVDSPVTQVGEPIQAEVSISGRSGSQPELTGANNFKVLGTSSGHSVQLVNGVLTVSTTVAYSLVPLHEGASDITAVLRLGNQTVRSNTIRVTVGANRGGTTAPPGTAPSIPPQGAPPVDQDGKNAPIFLRASLTPKNPIVGGQVTAEYYVHIREGIQPKRFNITAMPEFTGFVSYELPTSNNLSFVPETIEGQNFRAALIKRWALFPVGPGEATAGPIEVQLEVPQRRRRPSFGIDPFENFDSFFGQGKIVSLSSPPVNITARPAPAANRPPDWDAAVGNYTVRAQLDRSEVPVGEPLELKIVVSGDGNVDAVKRPALRLDNRLRIYSEKDKPEVAVGVERVSGQKTFETILIASAPGDFEIPELRLPFFDPEKNDYRVATAAPLRFKATGQALAEKPQTQGVISRESIELRGRDLRYIRPNLTQLRLRGPALVAAPWIWIALGAWPLLVLGLMLYQLRSGRLRADRRTWRSRRAMREAKQRLAEAEKLLGQQDAIKFYAELHRAVLGFIADKLDAAAPGLGRQELMELLTQRGVNQQAIDVLDALWREADEVRFGGRKAEPHECKEALKKANALLADLGREWEG